MLSETTSIIEAIPAILAWRKCLQIGGVTLGLQAEGPDGFDLDPQSRGFEVEWNNSDIQVTVQWADQLSSWRAKKDFDSGSLWALYREPEELVFDFTSPAISLHPYKRVCVSRDFRNATITLSHRTLQKYLPVFPLEYPANELLITNHLATGLGVEVHGCGIVDSETGGHLFLGHSGAGKSTTTKLWTSLRNVEVLSDDRIILRMHQGEVWMYGTPWHGEAAFASAARAKISRIFILEHGERNQVIALSPSRAGGELFARSFPPFHSERGLAGVMSFLHRAVAAVPCYEFEFVPDQGAVNAVLNFHD